MITSKEQLLQNIITIRKEKGYSQEYVAERIGRKQAGYSAVESGKRKIDYEFLLHLAVIFDMSVIDIITYPSHYVASENCANPEKITLSIDVNKNTFEQVVKSVFGENRVKLLNK